MYTNVWLCRSRQSAWRLSERRTGGGVHDMWRAVLRTSISWPRTSTDQLPETATRYTRLGNPCHTGRACRPGRRRRRVLRLRALPRSRPQRHRHRFGTTAARPRFMALRAMSATAADLRLCRWRWLTDLGQLHPTSWSTRPTNDYGAVDEAEPGCQIKLGITR